MLYGASITYTVGPYNKLISMPTDIGLYVIEGPYNELILVPVIYADV